MLLQSLHNIKSYKCILIQEHMDIKNGLVFAQEHRNGPDNPPNRITVFYHSDSESEPIMISREREVDAMIYFEGEIYIGNSKGTIRLRDGKQMAPTKNYVYSFALFKGTLLASDVSRIYRPLSRGRLFRDFEDFRLSEKRDARLFDMVDTMVEHDGALYFAGYSGRRHSGIFRLDRDRQSLLAKFTSPVKSLVSMEGSLYISHGMIEGAFPDPKGECHVRGLENKFHFSKEEQIWNMIGKDGKLLCSGEFNGIVSINPVNGKSESLFQDYGRIGEMAVVPEHFDVKKFI